MGVQIDIYLTLHSGIHFSMYYIYIYIYVEQNKLINMYQK